MVDFETAPDINLTLSLTVVDSGNPPANFTKIVAVKIADVNEPATEIQISNNQVSWVFLLKC